jgi:hypothetical protein
LEYDDYQYSEEQKEARKGEVLRKYWPKYRTYFIIHDNGHPTFSGWYKESHCRETAFSDAIWYLNMRIVSGLPTKKPYIITVNERKHSKGGKIKDGRKWDIKLEITKR